MINIGLQLRPYLCMFFHMHAYTCRYVGELSRPLGPVQRKFYSALQKLQKSSNLSHTLYYNY